MSRSAIYVANTSTGNALASGSTYAPSTIIRRFGGNCQMANNGVNVSGAGYYSVDVTVTVVATAVGTVTATLYQDGKAIVGATATEQAAAIGDVVTLPLTALVRLNCECQESTITVGMGTTVTSSNLAMKVERI